MSEIINPSFPDPQNDNNKIGDLISTLNPIRIVSKGIKGWHDSLVEAASILYSLKRTVIGFLGEKDGVKYMLLLDHLHRYFTDTKSLAMDIRDDIIVIDKLLEDGLEKISEDDINEAIDQCYMGMVDCLTKCMKNCSNLLHDINTMYVKIVKVQANANQRQDISRIVSALNILAGGVAATLFVMTDMIEIRTSAVVTGSVMAVFEAVKFKADQYAKNQSELNLKRLDEMEKELMNFRTILLKTDATTRNVIRVLRDKSNREILLKDLKAMITLCHQGMTAVIEERERDVIIKSQSNGIHSRGPSGNNESEVH